MSTIPCVTDRVNSAEPPSRRGPRCASAPRAWHDRPMVALDRPGTLGLLEREAEMAQLRAVLDAVRAGMGRLVAVQGEAGGGKTAPLAAPGRGASREGVSGVPAPGAGLQRHAPLPTWGDNLSRGPG